MAFPSSQTRHKNQNDGAVGNKDSTLSAWASEIRKLQSEVDREAELEAKRLEEEIAASRLQRVQRKESSKLAMRGVQTNLPQPSHRM
jgi:peptidoglycan hydrolase CwlO-like protein